MLVHLKSMCAAFLSYRNTMSNQTSNAAAADLADTVERLSLQTKILQIRTGLWIVRKCSRIVYYFASVQLSIKSTYSIATINPSCGFASDAHFIPGTVAAGAADGKTVACGLCGGRAGGRGDSNTVSIISERNKKSWCARCTFHGEG